MSWAVDRITAKCAEFSAMVGDTYDCPIVLNERIGPDCNKNRAGNRQTSQDGILRRVS